jgi:hypothetical protein
LSASPRLIGQSKEVLMTKLLSDPENVHSADIHGLRQSA